MAAPRYSAAERDELRSRASRLLARRMGTREIAEQLDISRELAGYYIRTVRKLWKQQAARDFDLDVARQLEELDEVRREAWGAWAKEPSAGYLAVVLQCARREAELLGLDAPKKIDLEQDIRQWAVANGHDPDLAVQVAMREAKRAAPTGRQLRVVS